ncbi:MAG TPA: hypothetical protein VMB51_15685 [Solirubrobacteraceae bacterium]|nr:hypothetical protein [Solirubrobacteraceae bacterium]
MSDASGDVYVAGETPVGDEAVRVYEPIGSGGYRLLSEWTGADTPEKELYEVTGLAVDDSSGPLSGDVFVVEAEGAGTEHGVVEIFKPRPNPTDPQGVEEGAGEEGEFVGTLSGPKLEAPNGIAVSPATGRVLVADSVRGQVDAYSPSGAYETKFSGKGSPYGSFKGKEESEDDVAGLGFGGAAAEGFYVAEAGRGVVSQYGEDGEWLGWITGTPEAPLREPSGVAATTGGEVVVADPGSGRIDLYGPTVVVPDVLTGKIAKGTVTREAATLTGTINGDGNVAGFAFEYGESRSLGTRTSSQSAGTGEQEASLTVTGLQPARTYYYRIVGENENGESRGIVRQFETSPAVEDVSTGAASNIEPGSATLTGRLTPGGLDTHYHFEWGTTESYGSQGPEPFTDAGAGSSPVEATTGISSLAPNTLYHYRLVAENSFGVTYGEDRTFATSGAPRIVSEAPSGLDHEGATLHAKLDPDQLATTYRFEYGETNAYGQEAPLGGASIGSGSDPVAVSAVLTGLRLGATYHYRVVAQNEAGTTYERDQTFETTPAASVDATYVTNVDATDAQLHAVIDPDGRETTFEFQYGTQSCDAEPTACATTPSSAEGIGSGETGVPETANVTGLRPDTTYYYRIIASNSLGTTEGREQSFTTQEAVTVQSLPDGRAWEMVSPPEKHGAPIEPLTTQLGGWVLASEDGDAITYLADGALTGEPRGNRAPEQQQIVSTRGEDGWTTSDIVTPNQTPQGIQTGAPSEYQYFTADLSQAIVEPVALTAVAEPPLASGVKEATMYVRDNGTGSYVPIVSERDTVAGAKFGDRTRFLEASPDLTHVVLSSSVPLTEGAPPSALYEWSAGSLRPVSILPGNAGFAASPELGYHSRIIAHTISSDGSRVIWSDAGHLYLRDTASEETIQLDAPAPHVKEPPEGSAEFQAATGDDSRIFFTDKQKLTLNATAESAGTGKADLYECEIAEVAGKPTCQLSDLTPTLNSGEPAAVQGLVLGIDEAGTDLYLIAQGVLANNENAAGQVAGANGDNLYALRSAGNQWAISFVATLASADNPEWEGGKQADQAFVTARVSPNGQYFAFMSNASLTGYDNVDANPAADGARDEEVYIYDADTERLTCVSCDHSGGRPEGVLDTLDAGEGFGLFTDRRGVWENHWLSGNIPGWTAQNIASGVYQTRYLSDEGRLFFDSPDDLVPAAENHKEDVYEYEPEDVGSCQTGVGGCVALISSGSSGKESVFMEATPSGDDVFFLTAAQLVAQDTDSEFDVYDARVCTAAHPCLGAPNVPSAPCGSTEECRPVLAQQPVSVSANAPAVSGNVASPAPAPSAKIGVKAAKAVTPASRSQQLAKALGVCRRRYRRSDRRRRSCERAARKHYGPASVRKKAKPREHSQTFDGRGRRS